MKNIIIYFLIVLWILTIIGLHNGDIRIIKTIQCDEYYKSLTN